MFQVAEGIKGVHILGVVQSKDALEDLLKICPINPQSRYVLIEVGMQKETVQGFDRPWNCRNDGWRTVSSRCDNICA